ncbi:carbon-nitrogen hydrolase family protein [Mycolicibacterium goodii]|uniref:carbon-nitrogen hydrolase family protein n=1 Tax=Mycolicibacterium goodii TaxID=134601 RepID=UPI000C261B4A|nr:carbon-nitrogen hydrolase family protein [Mycolicibacterium goodii]PJK18210.1 hydrolase [Mycolicibacterium goodii]
MYASICQFAPTDDPVANASSIVAFAEQAAMEGSRLLLTPEASMIRFGDSAEPVAPHAQPLDGQFVTDLAAASAEFDITIVAGAYTPGSADRAVNTLVAVQGGKLIGHYDKLHLYDAFDYAESNKVQPGKNSPVTIDVDGIRFGLATCYDLRFPEIFRVLVDAGADAFLLPAAWVKGTSKEEHWFTLLRARAIENTAYVLASGEAGIKSIGRSAVFDPMGLQLADLGMDPGLVTVKLDRLRIDSVRRTLPCLNNRRFAVVARQAD